MFGFRLQLLALTLMIALLLLQIHPANSHSIINPPSVEEKDEVWNFPCQGGSNVFVVNKHGIFRCNNKTASRMKEKPLRSLRENPRGPSRPAANPGEKQNPGNPYQTMTRK